MSLKTIVPLFMAVLMIAACATNGTDGTVPPGDAPPAVAPFANLTAHGDVLGWDEILLDMTRQGIERKTGISLDLERGEAAGCGEYTAETTVDGRSMNLQMAMTGDQYVLNSIFVEFNGAEADLSMEQLAGRVQQKLPLRYEPSRHNLGEPDPPSSGFYRWTQNDDMAVLLKPGRGYYITRYGCVD